MSRKKRKRQRGEFTSAAPVVASRGAHAERGAVELGAMLDALPSAALLLDGETEEVLHWNQPAKALFGLTASEALGMPFRCLVPDQLRLALETSARTVGTIEKPAGRKTFIEMTVRPIADRAGRAYMLVHLLDITARHSVAAQLRDFTQQHRPAAADIRQAASHTRLMEAMLTHLPVGVFFLDTEMVFLFANAHYGALVGIPAQELLGRHFFEVFPHTEAATAQLLNELKLVEPGTPLNGVAIPWELPGDRTTYWDLAVTSVQNDAGGIDGFLVVVNEVSERVRLEQDLNRHIEFLREAQHLANLGSWELELPSQRMVWSAEVYRIFGLEAGENVPTFDDYLRHVHPDDRAAAARVLQEALRTQRPFHSDRRILRADGAERVLR
ncbi:MAG: PAS domain-containing protein, partial [Candidatus Sericytochromatia bacterium]